MAERENPGDGDPSHPRGRQRTKSPLKSIGFQGAFGMAELSPASQKVKVSGSPPKLAMVAVALRK